LKDIILSETIFYYQKQYSIKTRLRLENAHSLKLKFKTITSMIFIERIFHENVNTHSFANKMKET